MLPVAGLSLLLVFYKINEKPFIFYLEAAVNYYISSKLFIWKQRLAKPGQSKEEDVVTPTMTSVIPMTAENKLKDLSWSLEVKEKSSK